MKEKKKRNIKKAVLITVSIILAIILVVIAAGYFIMNKAFSMLTESMYPSSESHYETTLEENKVSGELDEENAERTESENQGNGKTAKPNDSLAKAQQKFGIGGSMNFSAEDLKRMEKSVSVSDKLAVLAIISRGLSTQDYQRLLAMTSGGITRSEVSQAFSILKNGLKSGDKDKIYEYYKKYSYLLEGN